jgi:hypothetical protein
VVLDLLDPRQPEVVLLGLLLLLQPLQSCANRYERVVRAVGRSAPQQAAAWATKGGQEEEILEHVINRTRFLVAPRQRSYRSHSRTFQLPTPPPTPTPPQQSSQGWSCPPVGVAPRTSVTAVARRRPLQSRERWNFWPVRVTKCTSVALSGLLWVPCIAKAAGNLTPAVSPPKAAQQIAHASLPSVLPSQMRAAFRSPVQDLER